MSHVELPKSENEKKNYFHTYNTPEKCAIINNLMDRVVHPLQL